MKFIYPAIFHKTGDGRFHGYFPDLTDCRAEGDTIDDAVENANAAAYDWITVELEDDGHLPPVSDPKDLALKEGEILRHISVSYRFMEGWEE